jgi:hypothetical protein
MAFLKLNMLNNSSRPARRIILLMAILADGVVTAEERLPQEMFTLPVQVIDELGEPVAGVRLIPWALRSSQGHGPWPEKILGKLPEFATNEEGHAALTYPRYAYPDEFVQTTEVTLSVDHPDYVFISHEDIAIPVKDEGAYTISIERGGNMEVVPMQNGKSAAMQGVYAEWSDARWYQTNIEPITTVEGTLRLPPMAAGGAQVLLVRVENERATYFSRIVDFEIAAGETSQMEVELRPAVRLQGMLSADVPRPIKNGRIVARTLAHDTSWDDVTWGTWATINTDGSFAIENWPAEEAIQIIALTEDHIAMSGNAPAVVATPPLQPDPFNRPQVFQPDVFGEPLTVEMEPMVECVVETLNGQNQPLAGVKVEACPNVGWWNGGSQIYCEALYSFEKFIVERDSSFGLESTLPSSFSTISNQKGIARLYLPVGKESLYAHRPGYELPIIRGRRNATVELAAGQTMKTRLVLQPSGQEFLGEWDKLAGVLFGCTGEECRRLLDNPGFRERITAVRLKLDSANGNDPKTLQNAFADISAAFDEVGDEEEVARWRRKAEEQAAKLKAD